MDPIYQLRIIKPEELTFKKKTKEYYKIMFKNEMVGFIGIKIMKKRNIFISLFIEMKDIEDKE